MVTVEFHLDNGPKTFIKKDALVRKIDGPYIGVEFASYKSYGEYNKEIGFYMMN